MADATAALLETAKRRPRRRRLSISSDDSNDNNAHSPSSNEGPSSNIVSLVSDDDEEPPLRTRPAASSCVPQKPSSPNEETANDVVKKHRSRSKKVQKVTGYSSLTNNRNSKKKSRLKRHRNQEEGTSIENEDGTDDEYQPVQKRRTKNSRRAECTVSKVKGGNQSVEIVISDDEDDFEAVKKKPRKPVSAASRTVRFEISRDEDILDEKSSDSSVQASTQPIAERVRDFDVKSVAVSNQKRKQIRSWLSDALTGTANVPKFLVLHGPSGCGKWTTLRALFREFNVEPMQWSPSIPPDGTTSVLGSLLESLEAFLVGTNYPALPGLQAVTRRRVAVLRDLPISLADPNYRKDQLREILSQHITSISKSVPTICLLSDNALGIARLMRLIGPNLESNMATIRVYKPSVTATRKALNLVVKKEGIKTTAKHIGELAEAANGDLRLALNALHLYGNGNKRKKNSDEIDISSIAAKDGTLGTYHAVSKVLNNKKNEDGESKYDVEQILEDAQADPMAFMGFLHQNYTDFFGDYEDAMHALEALSEADCLMKWQSDHLNRNCLNDCAASVATRAFLLYNEQPVRSGWRPIRGPEYFSVQNNAREFKDTVRWKNKIEAAKFGRSPEVVTKSTILEQVAYAEKIEGFQIAPWHESNNGLMKSEDADIAMVDAESTVAKAEPLAIELNSNSNRGESDDTVKKKANLSEVKEEEVEMERGKREELEEEIEDWDSDVGSESRG